MSLNRKVALLIAALFLLSGVASVGVERWVIRPNFLALEREEAERNTGRAVEAIHHELDVLSTTVSAWAWRDDLQRFLRGDDTWFAERGLSEEAIASAAISYLGVYRLDGKQVIHRAHGAGSAGLGRLQEATLPASHPLLRFSDPRAATAGLVGTPSGPMLVAARPVLGTSGTDSPTGVLIFGRLLDAGAVDRIAERHRLDLRIEAATSAELVAAEPSPPPDWEPGEPRRATSVRVDTGGDNLIGQTAMADLHGEPVLTLTVTTPRSISARGDEASRFALLTLGAVGLAVLALLSALVHRTILRPIAVLTRHAVRLGKDDASAGRLALDRSDELGLLACEFDRMTDRLAEARQRLVDQSFVSGKADMAAGILHNVGNAVTPVAVRLEMLRAQIKAAPLDEVESAAQELAANDAMPGRRTDLARFVELASLELVALLRSLGEGLTTTFGQIAHVQQILTDQSRYSRLGAEAQRVELERLVREVADGLSAELRAAAQVVIDPSVSALGAVLGPRVTIHQLVGNLLLNAAESIHGSGRTGGRIVVRAHPAAGAEPAVVDLSFEDDGAGIEPATLARIFERRFTTKQRGSGLGLHWSANAVAALGGRLTAESRGAGLGATFHLLLPLAEAPSGAQRMGTR
jgi:two-component system NtrC family sensor kinase